jgi:DNA-binding response OmpR family regulator
VANARSAGAINGIWLGKMLSAADERVFMAKLLFVDDDERLLSMEREWFESLNHTVETANCVDRAEDLLAVSQYDLLVLDWSMPGKTGLELCKELRHKKVSMPILMLTGNDTEDDKEAGLDGGADDYLTKPFSMRELSARVRALLRRASGAHSNILSHGAIELDVDNHECTVAAEQIVLMPKEFALLEFLMRHPGQVFSADALIERVWKADTEATEDAIRTCVMRLRKKLSAIGDCIETIPRVGYKLKAVAVEQPVKGGGGT